MLLIKNADVYAPESIGINDILVAGTKIEMISPSIDISLPCLEVLDAEGEMVHPGLIDGHVHAIGGGGEAGMASRVPPISERKIIEGGVTSVVGLLGTDGYTRTVRDLVARVKGLREWGITAWALTGSYQIPSITLTGSVGDDIAFIDEIIGVKTAIADHRCSFPTADELIRLSSEVRIASLVSGKAGLIHIHVGASEEGISLLFDIKDRCPIPISHFYPTHMGSHMDQALRWAALGGHVDITCHDDADEKAELLLERFPGQITLSTDSNGSFPKWNEDKSAIVGMGAGSISELIRYLDKMIASGFDKKLAIRSVTENPAEAMHLKGKGRIAPGYDADIVIRDGSKLRYVIAGGSVLMRDGIAKRGMFEDIL